MATEPEIKQLEKVYAREAQFEQQAIDRAVKEVNRAQKAHAKAVKEVEKAERNAHKSAQQTQKASKFLEKQKDKYEKVVKHGGHVEGKLKKKQEEEVRSTQEIKQMHTALDELLSTNYLNAKDRTGRLQGVHAADGK
ncbi:hypothetical protein OBBRIDRAFT_250810 [Obba rivulosa]|uniref:Uncharacterized protein n=1 Tax=Obba rivulosa TaxID=1052685 RepID=A0A8E2DKW7_9APHY|nr:hypothetical protein OBBRIDRAFT_250810 [Obba rivulosa]